MSPIARIAARARRLGFAMMGVAPAGELPTWPRYVEWLSKGYAGAMDYLVRRADERRDVRMLWPDARSAIVVGVNYRTQDTRPDPLPPNRGIVSSYAWGDDYHDWVRARLDMLLAVVREEIGSHVRGRGHVDAGPILERDLARLAGLGWFGRNTMLIHPQFGSWFFIAELLLNVELPVTTEHIPDRCGSCARCLAACPTGALVGPHVLDARRCISYLTIEHKGLIPREVRPLMGAHIFGCDICQEVCPWNRKAPATDEKAFRPRDDLRAPDLISLLGLTEEAFRARFRRSPILRAKRRGFLRNVAVAIGNVGDTRAIPALERALCDDEPIVRAHAGWALMRLAGGDAVAPLAEALRCERDEGTRADLAASLDEARGAAK